MEEVTTANWKEMAEAAGKIVDMAKEIVESDKEISKDLGIRIATENQKLVPFALKINGKFPTHASGNGEFTHPLLHWNLLAEHLEMAGVPLSEPQEARIVRLGEEYDAQWERLQGTYAADTLDLEKVMDEVEIKKTFNDKLEGLLTRDQRESIAPSSIRHVNALDVYSPILLLAGRCLPVAKDSKESLRKAAAARFSERWKIEASQLEAQSALLDGWLADVESRLVPVPERLVNWFNIQDAIVSGRAQIKVMKELVASTAIDEAAKKKITGEVMVIIPRLLAKP